MWRRLPHVFLSLRLMACTRLHHSKQLVRANGQFQVVSHPLHISLLLVVVVPQVAVAAVAEC
jgi:hypothetical protein